MSTSSQQRVIYIKLAFTNKLLFKVCYYSVQNTVSLLHLPEEVKFTTYKPTILPFVLCDFETRSPTLRTNSRWRFIQTRMVTGIFRSKGKGKGRLWVLQHWCLEAYCTLTRMSSFIHLQRRYTHQEAWETSASEGRNYTWNLASNP